MKEPRIYKIIREEGFTGLNRYVRDYKDPDRIKAWKKWAKDNQKNYS